MSTKPTEWRDYNWTLASFQIICYIKQHSIQSFFLFATFSSFSPAHTPTNHRTTCRCFKTINKSIWLNRISLRIKQPNKQTNQHTLCGCTQTIRYKGMTVMCMHPRTIELSKYDLFFCRTSFHSHSYRPLSLFVCLSVQDSHRVSELYATLNICVS